ncbi:M1 family metallopeptidase [Massilia terrae]|uniref:Aminopeptidase n=1 Tax=Massilia terrae TaxID=1811224 RepID=A0ABT2CYZ6_9BURK|nr:M1 family metallopeptidase [Massilia terrae]MCS0659201.1 M1 family metallopeptidase [Massilia terrae]
MKHHLLRAAIAAAFALDAGAAFAEAPFSFAATPGKLPKDVLPIQYAAHIVPDIAANTFRGEESVEIDVLKPTSAIMLNADKLQIANATLSGNGLAPITLVPAVDARQQTVSFSLPKPIKPGRYRLAMQFSGQINREARGMFYMNYKSGADSKKMIATTMEPTDARRLLPSWDEPSFRARYKLSIDVPASFSAYSNTPVDKRQVLADGKQRISFALTPKMPSYLVVLAAGELERLSGKQDGVDIGVVTTKGKLGSAAAPLADAKEIIHYYNGYFGVPYPLPKLDLIAMPGGFNGAMENWGGITYNESALLVDPQRSAPEVRQGTFMVNAHEIAHQWFGNLVTMAWWDNLWLNEGFASWMSSKATDHFHPEWRPYLNGIAEREGVLNLDARKTTHPIQTRIDNESQAANAFDAITYEKGQGFLRMLEDYLGEDAFRKGIRNYMATHKYSNTTSQDLWNALEQASGKPVGQLASDWTTQPGFPLIKVEQACENGKRMVTLSQQQFRVDEPAAEQRLWHVPLQVGTVNGRAIYTLLSTASTTFEQGGCEGALVVDPYSVGFFRIQYDPQSFQALSAQAAKLPDPTRLKLLTDTWALVSAGSLPLDSYLKLVRAYQHEPRLAVWQSIGGNLGALYRLADKEPEQALIARFINEFATPKMRELGWDERPGESAEDKRLRALLAMALAQTGDADAIAQARQRFARYLADPASVSPSMLEFVLRTTGRYADAATYDAIAKRTLEATNTEERNRLGRALTSVRDPALAARTLALALSSDLPPSLAEHMVADVGREHTQQAWEFAVEHREALLKNLNALAVDHAFADVVGGSSNAADADMMEDYVRKNFGPDALVEAQRVGNGIRVRAAQKARLLPQVREALK